MLKPDCQQQFRRHPVGDRIVVALKAWPAQSIIFMPESYTVIRGQQYVTEVIAVGEDVKLVEKETWP
jgi:hypothetical protein